MTQFLTELAALDVAEGTQTRAYKLLEDFVFYSDVLKDTVRVPKGFTFDGESIPEWLQGLVPPFGQSKRAACAHDFLYRYAGYWRPDLQFDPVSRKTADAVYRELALAKGLPKWRAWMRHTVLRIVGGAAWRANREREDQCE